MPASTYRVQVNGAFPLSEAERIVPYLRRLGAGDLYTSPILRSTEGSTHGYDVLAHDAIDDEAGGRAALDSLSETLRANGLGLVLDVVPNHVSVAPPAEANAWWWDVLKHGRDSRYAKAFDVDWSRHGGRVLLPVLAGPLADVLDEIVREGDTLRYHEHVWPLRDGTVATGSEASAETAGASSGDGTVAEILIRQHYLPEHWRRGCTDLNYRRFFDVTTLAGLRVEEESVFEESHALVLSLVRDGIVTGLRIDHPDGLADPAAYLARLAERSGGVWTVVEKILEHGETLPGWACHGTTGYDALALVTDLFTDAAGAESLTRTYAEYDPRTYAEVVEESKRHVLREVLASEVDWLHRLLPEVARDAIVELLVAFDVYRTYVVAGTEPTEQDAAALHRAVTLASERRPDLANDVARVAAEVAVGSAFATRFQQTSGPAMAKGVEDTAFYRYTRLVSSNEVGGAPDRVGGTVEEFHAACLARAATTMNALSTHDTKRGEDVRARLALLSEVPDEWAAAVRRWSAMAKRHGTIEPNLAYLMFQTFVGAWPLDADRAVAYAAKASREQKQRTSWLDPDPAYEAEVERWVRGLLADEDFVADLEAFVAPLVVHGWAASLARKLVQLTMPGVPDVYQGSETWDLSLVDPDNRRPVDYDLRARLLADLDTLDVEEVGDRAAEGLPKMLVVSRALRLRRSRPEAFAGSYEPLETSGAWADRVVAFARGGDVVTVVPRLSVHVDDWKDTTVALPAGTWRDVLTGDPVDGGDRQVAEVLSRFPVALWERA